MTTAGNQPAANDEAEHWREAARLRDEHPGWVVVWLARNRRYKAYKRMPGARRDTALTATTAARLATEIRNAERAAVRPVTPGARK